MSSGSRKPGEILLSVRNLHVEFRTGNSVVHAVNGVSFDIHNGETLAVLGESGSGKSVTFEAVLGILDSPPGKISAGKAVFEGSNLFDLAHGKRRAICGKRIGMIFQDPLSALNPVYSAGWQISEMFRVHRGLSTAEANQRALELLQLVGIPDPEQRARNYPHQFSGGMRQRLVIAMAIAVDPLLVIADEPTTALDVTVEAQILALLKNLQQKNGLGLVIITHSMGVVAEVADRVCVMYAGQIVEMAAVRAIFNETAHPYTLGLLNSSPNSMSGNRLTPIDGQPPDLASIPPGCPFHPRCAFTNDRCRTEKPELRQGPAQYHTVACHFFRKVVAARGREVSV